MDGEPYVESGAVKSPLITVVPLQVSVGLDVGPAIIFAGRGARVFAFILVGGPYLPRVLEHWIETSKNQKPDDCDQDGRPRPPRICFGLDGQKQLPLLLLWATL